MHIISQACSINTYFLLVDDVGHVHIQFHWCQLNAMPIGATLVVQRHGRRQTAFRDTSSRHLCTFALILCMARPLLGCCTVTTRVRLEKAEPLNRTFG
jgi:hypothetical protein